MSQMMIVRPVRRRNSQKCRKTTKNNDGKWKTQQTVTTGTADHTSTTRKKLKKTIKHKMTPMTMVEMTDDVDDVSHVVSRSDYSKNTVLCSVALRHDDARPKNDPKTTQN